MPYTATQLNTYYQALTGVAPDPTTTLLFQAYSTQNTSGSLSDAQTLANVFNSVGVQSTFEVAQATYQFFTGATTSAAGLAFLEGVSVANPNPNGLTTTYYNGTGGTITAPNTTNGFNVENRYYNFAINLASAGGAGNASFTASYGTLTFAQTVAAAYENIVGSANVGAAAANAAIADITSRLAFFQQVASTRGGDATALTTPNASLTLKAVVVGYILEEANKADVGTYAKAIDQFEASVAAGNALFNTNALVTYGAGGVGFNTGVGVSTTTATVGTGTSIALTSGTDVINATSGNATIAGLVVGAGGTGVATLTAADTINAQGANNTFLITTSGNNTAVAIDATGGAIITGVQTIDVRSTAGADGTLGTAVVNAQLTPGGTAFNAYQSSGAVTFNNIASGGVAGIVGNGILANGFSTFNYTAGATAAALNLTGGTVAASFNVTGTTLTSATVTSSAAANGLGNFQISAPITTLNIVANTALSVAAAGGALFVGSNAAATAGTLTTVNVSGAGAVNLGTINDSATFAESNTIRTFTSTSTGGVTARFAAAVAGGVAVSDTITTAAGVADFITIDGALAGASVINLGGGSATVGDQIAFTGTIGAGAQINGGGNGTITTTQAQFQQISGSAAVGNFTVAQRGNITGFSTVALSDALVNGATYDVNTIGATSFGTQGVAAGGAANLFNATGGTVTFGNAITTNTGTLVVSEAGATLAAQTTDVLNIVAQAQSTSNTLNLTTTSATSAAGVVTGIETLNVSANLATGVTGIGLTANIGDNAATLVTFAGNESFFFTPTTAAGANQFGALTTVTSTNTGSANIDVHLITTGTTAAPITVTAGAGVDYIGVGNYDRVTLGGGATNFVESYTTTNGNSYSSILDANSGTRLSFQVAATSVNATKITLNPTAAYQDYLDAATASTAAGGGRISAFDFGGNTYVVEDNSASATFQNGTDTVIQLVGIHTLSGTLGAAVGATATHVATLGATVNLLS